jgi:NADH-quinone oxidoreductase subunit L
MPHVGTVLFVSLGALVAGAGGAYALYRGRDKDPVSLGILRNKFYLDELYARIVGLLQDGVAKIMSGIDYILIDGLGVKGGSFTVLGIGSLLRRLQVGNLQGYALLFGFGVVLLILISMTKL